MNKFLVQSFFALLFLVAPLSSDSKVLKMVGGQAPVTFDWTGKNTMIEGSIMNNIQEGLFRYQQPEGKLVPALAESFSHSADHREYTFVIRKNAKWSDGRPVFAQDFVYGWLKMLSPQSTSFYIFYLFGIQNAVEYNHGKITNASEVGIRALDDRTLQVKLKRPYANWQFTTAFWPLFPVRKDQVEKFGSNWSRAGLVLGTGPYVLDSYEVGKKLVLTQNKYYPTPPAIDRVEVEYIKDFDPAIRDFAKNDSDVILDLPYTKLNLIEKRSDFKRHQIMRLVYLAFNVEHFPFNNILFRQAILKGLDQSSIVPSRFIPSKAYVAKPLPGSDANVIPQKNIAEALKLIKKSGVAVGPKLKLPILTIAREPYWAVGKLVQEQLIKNLGLTVDLNALDSTELSTAMSLGSYGIEINSWTSKMNIPADFLFSYTSDNNENSSRYTSKVFDQLMLVVATAATTKKQKEALLKVQKFFTQEQAVFYPLFFDYNYYLINSKIKSLYFDHMGNYDLRAAHF